LSVVLIILAIVLLALFVLAVARPWIGLLVLLVGLPFNGLLLHVGAPPLALTGTAATMFAAWHDALAAGVIVAAGLQWLRVRPRSFGALELGVVIVLALGLDSLVVTPHSTTALYAYRTLFEPIALMLAVVVLGRGRRLPEDLPGRASLAIVVAAVAASFFTYWQIYIGSFSFLSQFYRAADGSLSGAYLAVSILQPRAIGTFNSPNEFGAYLVIALCLLSVTAAGPSSGRWRAWALVPIGVALLLSISRSAWVSLFGAILILVVSLPNKREHLRALGSRLRTLQWWRAFAPPLTLLVVLIAGIGVSTGVPNFIGATFDRTDPSASVHFQQLSNLLGGNIDNPAPTPTPTVLPAPSTSEAVPATAATPSLTPPITAASLAAAVGTPAAPPEAPSAVPCPSPSVAASTAPGASATSAGSAAGTPVPGVRYVTVCKEVSTGTHVEPFGMGLGAVGPKSDRFGETPVLLNSETWYLDYLWQAGYFGLIALLGLAAIIFRRLWRGRRNAMSRVALAVTVGLAAGALFIPVLDEPAVAIPMWTLVAFGLLAAEREPTTAETAPEAV
jgi:hypothetical protein